MDQFKTSNYKEKSHVDGLKRSNSTDWNPQHNDLLTNQILSQVGSILFPCIEPKTRNYEIMAFVDKMGVKPNQN